MDVILGPAVKLLVTVIDLYMWVVVIAVILSWLTAFNVVNPHNRVVAIIGEFVYRATEPVLGRIRALMPSLGSFDISPIILILGLVFLRDIIIQLAMKVGA